MDARTLVHSLSLKWMMDHKVDVIRDYKEIFLKHLKWGALDMLKILHQYRPAQIMFSAKDLLLEDPKKYVILPMETIIDYGFSHVFQWILTEKMISEWSGINPPQF